ncbi:cytochrome o ubiquinol oxidase subunit IV [Paludibacterium yongneupense]|uniref:cytochrome o ubiquinol oxidase subunit IV n=1 Tax=Paludibacterium yongneupense TaxID=400061 RepID=UPI000422BC80|nr:cytochrome o ubiquinol oxidase subunit IV [Paludibacterium yongneupense]
MSQGNSHAASHGSVRSYATGFVLSLILTVIPFWMVMSGHFDRHTTTISIFAFAVAQILVHLKAFLHLNFTREGRINSFSFMFTALVIVLLVGLSIWILSSATLMMVH